MKKALAQLGGVSPNAKAVSFRYLCAIFESDGPSLMFCLRILVRIWLRWDTLLPMLVLSFLHVCKNRAVFYKFVRIL